MIEQTIQFNSIKAMGKHSKKKNEESKGEGNNKPF